MASSNSNQPSAGTIALWAEALESSSRRGRQDAAHYLSQVAVKHPELLSDHVDALVDALYRPEAQTRWEVMNALTQLVDLDEQAVAKAVDAAESSLFDEESSILRLAAFRLLSKLGATAPLHSDQAWPLLNEAVQCYHGDPEYRDMLVALLDFAQGDLSDEAKEGLRKRIAFDAENGTGYIKSYSKQIIAALS